MFVFNVKSRQGIFSVCKELNGGHLVEHARPNSVVREDVILSDHNRSINVLMASRHGPA